MEDLLNQALLLFGSAAIGLLGVVLTQVTNWIAKRIKNERIAAIVRRADDLAIRVTRDVYKSYVKPLKASGGGPMTDGQKQEARSQAIKQLKSYLGPKGLKEATWLVAGNQNLDGFLKTVVEHAVSDSKNVARAAGAPLGPR